MPHFNRRQLFKFRLGELSRELGRVARESNREEEDEEDEEEGEPFIRPPGALEDEAAFVETCERCHACAEACPYDTIRTFGPAFGRLENTPFMDPSIVPCHWCEEMPCINACPSGALRYEETENVPAVAKVSLDLDKCLNTQGILCDTCSFRCPTHIRAIRMVNRLPVLETDRCTGCGMCVFHCEAKPPAFELVFSDEHSAG